MAKNPAKGRASSYKVGKGRPPAATRWKPGQSGNPRGRPRGSKNLETILSEALNEKIRVQEKGRSRSMTAREVIGKRIVHAAMKGDLKSINLLLTHDSKVSGWNPAPADYYDALYSDYNNQSDDPLARGEQDARVLQSYLRLVRGDG
jgi:hypothetical protein